MLLLLLLLQYFLLLINLPSFNHLDIPRYSLREGMRPQKAEKTTVSSGLLSFQIPAFKEGQLLDIKQKCHRGTHLERTGPINIILTPIKNKEAPCQGLGTYFSKSSSSSWLWLGANSGSLVPGPLKKSLTLNPKWRQCINHQREHLSPQGS